LKHANQATKQTTNQPTSQPTNQPVDGTPGLLIPGNPYFSLRHHAMEHRGFIVGDFSALFLCSCRHFVGMILQSK
jgi:hypothetical protein